MISYILVFGGAFANFLVVLYNRDKTSGKSIINYDLALVCISPLLVGTILGLFI